MSKWLIKCGETVMFVGNSAPIIGDDGIGQLDGQRIAVDPCCTIEEVADYTPPATSNSETVQAQINALKAQFTTTLQMQALSLDTLVAAGARATIDNLLSQINALKQTPQS